MFGERQLKEPVRLRHHSGIGGGLNGGVPPLDNNLPCRLSGRVTIRPIPGTRKQVSLFAVVIGRMSSANPDSLKIELWRAPHHLNNITT